MESMAAPGFGAAGAAPRARGHAINDGRLKANSQRFGLSGRGELPFSIHRLPVPRAPRPRAIPRSTRLVELEDELHGCVGGGDDDLAVAAAVNVLAVTGEDAEGDGRREYAGALGRAVDD